MSRSKESSPPEDRDAQALPEGSWIGEGQVRFRLGRVLGRGGFGITYGAVDRRLGQRFTVKDLLPEGLATRIEGTEAVTLPSRRAVDFRAAVERFEDEARSLVGLGHPNIAPPPTPGLLREEPE